MNTETYSYWTSHLFASEYNTIRLVTNHNLLLYVEVSRFDAPRRRVVGTKRRWVAVVQRTEGSRGAGAGGEQKGEGAVFGEGTW